MPFESLYVLRVAGIGEDVEEALVAWGAAAEDTFCASRASTASSSSINSTGRNVAAVSLGLTIASV